MAPRTGASEASIAMSSRLHQLSAFGQSVWIDYLSRDLIESGALAKAVAEDAVVGVTSNPSIFEQPSRTGTLMTSSSAPAMQTREGLPRTGEA
jgi:transaldolase